MALRKMPLYIRLFWRVCVPDIGVPAIHNIVNSVQTFCAYVLQHCTQVEPDNTSCSHRNDLYDAQLGLWKDPCTVGIKAKE